MSHKLIAATLAAAALTLVGCAAPSPEASYLADTHGQSYASGISDSDLLALGHLICSRFDAGDQWAAVIGYETDAGFSGYQAGYMTALAVHDLCPQHAGELPATN